MTMSMLNSFFSMKYTGRSELFEKLDIWKDEKFRKLQGTYPVIFMTFAGVKGKNYEDTVKGIKKQIVKLFSEHSYIRDYDGFVFGNYSDIYNPWSITHFLKAGRFDTYWANTSGNGLVGHLIQNGDPDTKMEFEKLIKGECIEAPIDEQIIFNQLDNNADAIWSLLLASGYLTCEKIIQETPEDVAIYRLVLTNFEVKKMFEKMVRDWFNSDFRNGTDDVLMHR